MRIKNKNIIENIVIPIVLIIISFYDFNRGVDLSDAGYSLDFFLHEPDYVGTAIIPTFWSNQVGHLFTCLPFGKTWIGISFYCTLVISATILISYFFCKKFLNPYVAAGAEVLAIAYCWNPNVVLYDYLSFFFFTLGGILLYNGIISKNHGEIFSAGIILGINVFVRIPNVAEFAAVVLIWASGWMRKEKCKQIINDTLVFSASYFVGSAGSLAIILHRYGWLTFKKAIYNLFFLSNSDSGYGILSMLFTPVSIILREWKNIDWSFHFEEYTSIAPVSCLILLIGLILSFINLFVQPDEKLRLLSFVLWGLIIITPLGSNNHIFLLLMNMFLVAPIIVWMMWDVPKRLCDKVFSRKKHAKVIRRISCGMLLAVSVFWISQMIAFGVSFTWGDTIEVQASEPQCIAGMRTTSDRERELEQLSELWQRQGWQGKPGILYCAAPGLGFVLDVVPVLESPWSDWNTFMPEQMEVGIGEARRLAMKQEPPVVILNSFYGNMYEQSDGELNLTADIAREKTNTLFSFMREYEYKLEMKTENFAVYCVP